MDYSPPGSSIHGDSPGKNTGVGCHAFLQGICPTQGSNPGFLHCRRSHLSHWGSPLDSMYMHKYILVFLFLNSFTLYNRLGYYNFSPRVEGAGYIGNKDTVYSLPSGNRYAIPLHISACSSSTFVLTKEAS